MAVILTTAFIAELKKAENFPNTVLLIELDSGDVKYGQSAGGFSDVAPIIGQVSSLQNKLEPSKAYSTRGQITFQIEGRDNFKALIQNEYLKNRRVTRYDGFIAIGFGWADYAPTFTGIITDWKRKGDVLTITVFDDLSEGQKKIPEENATKTQFLDFTGGGTGLNPADIMEAILTSDITNGTILGIDPTRVDDTQFDSEEALWLNGIFFFRVLTEPKDANKYLNELQIETNSFIVHDGEKISFKVFAPPVPGTIVETWSDDLHVLDNSLICSSGYSDLFYNRIVVYFNYDESGNDKEENYESVAISTDTDSQSAGQWDEVKTKVIKSKWMRTIGFAPPGASPMSGVQMYHASSSNVTSGELFFTYDGGGEDTLKYKPFGAAAFGAEVTISKDGKYTIYGTDETKYVRVVVEYAVSHAMGANNSDVYTFAILNGANHAISLANKLASRYRNPSSAVSFEIDINNFAYNSTFRKPTDLVDLETDEAFEFGDLDWQAGERIMLTSVRPDMARGRVKIEAIETKQYRRYGFIADTGYPDYGSATAAQKERAFIGDASNLVNGGTVDGYYMWALPFFSFIVSQIAQVQAVL